MELGTMSLIQLQRLQTQVDAEIRRRSTSARRDLLKKMKKMAADEGLSLNDILAGDTASEEKPAPVRRRSKPASKKKTPLPFKYRHPENPSIGWSGRGRKPQWVIDWIGQNKPIQELEIETAK